MLKAITSGRSSETAYATPTLGNGLRPFAIVDPRSHAYNEQAFHYFLGLEAKRAERAGRSFLLVLVDLVGQGADERIDPMVASKLFRGLKGCLRDTDFIGWYREGRAAGAVLTELEDGLPVRTADVVLRRIRDMLYRQLPLRAAPRVRVRIYEQPEPEAEGSADPDHRGQSHFQRGIRCSS